MKAYCGCIICGDPGWLRCLWPAICQSFEFAWTDSNSDRWSPDRSGMLTGRQPHILDKGLFGPNTWLLPGCAKSLAEIAEALSGTDSPADSRALFEKGKAWTYGPNRAGG
jgi:hypothetical protein